TPTKIEDLPEGSYLVELQKVVEEEAFYKKHSFPVELTRNTSARIDLEIGPEDLLHGAILYYTPIRTTSDEGFLTVISGVNDSRVFIDGEFLKVSPVTNLGLRESQYEIKVLAPGHEEVKVPVLLRNNYVLNLKTFHFPIPVEFEPMDAEITEVTEDSHIEAPTEEEVIIEESGE
ncbi:MAG: WD40-domain containing protein, partial [candidate division WS6 bacterium 36_33]